MSPKGIHSLAELLSLSLSLAERATGLYKSRGIPRKKEESLVIFKEGPILFLLKHINPNYNHTINAQKYVHKLYFDYLFFFPFLQSSIFNSKDQGTFEELIQKRN